MVVLVIIRILGTMPKIIQKNWDIYKFPEKLKKSLEAPPTRIQEGLRL